MPDDAASLLAALPAPLFGGALSAEVDAEAMRHEFEALAQDAMQAQLAQLPLHQAVQDEENYPQLAAFHRTLRDALFVELPDAVQEWVASALPLQDSEHGSAANNVEQVLVQRAVAGRDAPASSSQALQGALAEFLLFESVRLRLLVGVWSNDEYESLGGDAPEIDAIAAAEVHALLGHPDIQDPQLRPTLIMLASASLRIHRNHAERAEALRHAGDEERETMRMQARLRAALRELRLQESVLLENALASLLGQERVELAQLQDARPLALAGMSRQAMDQRVSRSRRALAGAKEKWPRRKRPSLFDLLSGAQPFASAGLTPQMA